MQKSRKGLGRGLSALIPEADMDFLTRVARGELTPSSDTQAENHSKKSNSSKDSTLTTSPASDTQATKITRRGSGKKAPDLQASSEPLTSDSSQNNLPDNLESTLRSLAELIPLSQIEANPYQPRRTFSEEELQELSASIQQHGVLQPVLLRPIPSPPAASKNTGLSPQSNQSQAQQTSNVIQYQLIAGERRWRASQKAGLSEIPAIIRRVTDQQALELAVIENVQRHDISALDAANAYCRLAQEFSLSQDEIARRVGKSRVSISNTIRLLDLPTEIQNSIADSTLTEGHGRAILLAGSDGARRAVFRRVLRDKLSVRATEELARSIHTKSEERPNSTDEDKANSIDLKNSTQSLPEIRRIEDRLQKHFGTRVRLRPRKRGGQVNIQYFSNEELERLIKVLLHA